MSDVKTLLEEQIKCDIRDLGDHTIGSKERSEAVDETVRLMDKYNDMCRIESEHIIKEQEKELKLKEMTDEKIDRITKNAITAGTFIGGTLLTIWGTFKTLKFEETGTITTMMGRGFINKLLPKK